MTLADYTRPGTAWENAPSTATPIMAAWLNAVDDALTDLGGSAGRVKYLELAEFATSARTAAVSPASGMLGRTTRYNTSGGAITQGLPNAVAGAILAMSLETGGNTFTYSGASRSDSCATTSGQPVVTDASIVAADAGRVVTGAGIPANTYVGTVTPGVSFRLSSSPSSQVDVNATATSGAVTLAITDALGPAATISATLTLVGEVIVFHCTTAGRWRTIGSHKPTSALDARYVVIPALPSAQALVTLDNAGAVATLPKRDVREYTSTQSNIAVPTGALGAFVTLIGAGGGGGSGRRGAAASVRCGGGGGGSGGIVHEYWVPASAFISNYTVVVGGAGGGGAARTTNDTDGAAGSQGGNTNFQTNSGSKTLLRATGGSGGGGGTNSAGTAGGTGWPFAQGGGAASGSGGAGAAGGANTQGSGGGGGAGGGITSGDSASAGGAGGAEGPWTAAAGGGTGGVVGGAAPGAGTNGQVLLVASGAGGGAAATSGAAQDGASSTGYAAGGGGGGASVNGNNSGAGGSGGGGYARVTWVYA